MTGGTANCDGKLESANLAARTRIPNVASGSRVRKRAFRLWFSMGRHAPTSACLLR